MIKQSPVSYYLPTESVFKKEQSTIPYCKIGRFDQISLEHIRTVCETTQQQEEEFLSSGQCPRLATVAQKLFTIIREEGECFYCPESLFYLKKANIDHRTPYSAGGRTLVSNLVASCRPCNIAKGTMDFDKFRQSIQENGLEWRDKLFVEGTNQDLRRYGKIALDEMLTPWGEKI